MESYVNKIVIDSPTESYEKAKKTLVYTLSELVFGSLLASFALGFIAFAGGYLSGINDPIEITLKFCTYLLISGIFTYYTAGLYLYYHTGILTMPSFAFAHAKRDFTLSLLPAIAFGISMLQPAFLPLTLSFVIFRSLRIQKSEYEELIRKLKKYLPQEITEGKDGHDHPAPSENEEVIKGIITKIINDSKLEGWKPASRQLRKKVWGLFGLGIVTIVLYFHLEIIQYFNRNFVPKITFKYGKEIFLFIISIFLFILIYRNLIKVFKVSATFLSKDSSVKQGYDDEFKKLMQEIENYKKT